MPTEVLRSKGVANLTEHVQEALHQHGRVRGLLTFRRDSGLSQCQKEPAGLYHTWGRGRD